jgi:hypothetical protein
MWTEQTGRLLCQSQLAFFGLTPEYRSIVFQQLHEIVFHGKGGYDWNTVYNMPVWLRKYTFKSIQEFYEKQAEAQEEQMNRVQGIQKATSQNTVQMPDVVKKATYTTKKQ